EPYRGLELLLLLGSFVWLVPPWGAAAVRLHPYDASKLAVLASEWGNFNGSDTWQRREVDCHAMEGIRCDRDGHVTAIVLEDFELGAPIPDTISHFQRLTYLRLYFCQITGTIPSSISNLASLVLLVLGGNSISGSLPASISRLTRLQMLTLDFNRMSGPIDSICNLTQLRKLNLAQNRFNGSIPSSVGNLALEGLDISVNQLSGSIPDSLSRLQEVTYIALAENQLTGSIPESLAALNGLHGLYLHNNQLSGSIPASLASLQNLEYLFFDINSLLGSIPASLGDLLQLKYIHLQGNGFSGPVDYIVRTMKRIESLNLNHNLFSGRLPSPASSGILEYKMNSNFFTHGNVKFNCSAAEWSVDLNCLSTDLLICGRVPSSRSPAACAAFCGMEAGSTASVCEGHGYCSVNQFTGGGECVCDPNYLLDSTNTNVCLPGD
ncbi:unnamed protein product, partial [Closterium sp. Naga37s-1]